MTPPPPLHTHTHLSLRPGSHRPNKDIIVEGYMAGEGGRGGGQLQQKGGGQGGSSNSRINEAVAATAGSASGSEAREGC